eukprot:1221754-Prorocentrum_lima.AAC.1
MLHCVLTLAQGSSAKGKWRKVAFAIYLTWCYCTSSPPAPYPVYSAGPGFDGRAKKGRSVPVRKTGE